MPKASIYVLSGKSNISEFFFFFSFSVTLNMNTRRKRHRRSTTGSYSSVVIKNENDVAQEQNEWFRNEYRLENLPPEVLEMIFRFVPLVDVSTSIRLVSRSAHHLYFTNILH